MAEQASERVNSESVAVAGQSGSLPTDPALEHIRDALRGLRYGTVSIVVQDGLVVQIERTEKRRLR
jgi:hypothetical protein